MPIYVYKNCITGELEEHLMPIAKRDTVAEHLTRIVTMPSVVGDFKPEPTGASRTRDNLKNLEDEFGVREIERQTGFSAKELKETWSNE